MHVGEERFRTIRMSELEFANLSAALGEIIEEHGIDVTLYPMVDVFLAALGYAGGHHDAGEVVAEVQLPDEGEE